MQPIFKKTLGLIVKSKAIKRSSGCGSNMLPSVAFSFDRIKKNRKAAHDPILYKVKGTRVNEQY